MSVLLSYYKVFSDGGANSDILEKGSNILIARFPLSKTMNVNIVEQSYWLVDFWQDDRMIKEYFMKYTVSSNRYKCIDTKKCIKYNLGASFPYKVGWTIE